MVEPLAVQGTNYLKQHCINSQKELAVGCRLGIVIAEQTHHAAG